MPVIELVAVRAPAKLRAPGDGRVWRIVALWAAQGTRAWQRARRRRQTRRYIMTMDEQALSDIGVSRAQALFEIDNDRYQHR